MCFHLVLLIQCLTWVQARVGVVHVDLPVAACVDRCEVLPAVTELALAAGLDRELFEGANIVHHLCRLRWSGTVRLLLFF